MALSQRKQVKTWKEEVKLTQTHEARQHALSVAKNKSILEVAESLGMDLAQTGRSFFWSEHDSFIITPNKNTYYWNSRGEGGDTVKLVQLMKECSFKEAVSYLNQTHLAEFTPKTHRPKKFHYFAKEHESLERTYDYLINERQLSKQTVDYFVSKGLIAETTYKNKKEAYDESVIVFKHYGPPQSIKSVSFQGMVQNKGVHQSTNGYLKRTFGDGYYGMSIKVGHPPLGQELSFDRPLKILAFESPIDLMSYHELHREKLEDVILLSMNGLRKGTISTYLANHLSLDLTESQKVTYLDDLQKQAHGKTSAIQIGLAVDNDKAGKNFVDTFGISFVQVTPILPELVEGRTKSDWNDLLKKDKERIATITKNGTPTLAHLMDKNNDSQTVNVASSNSEIKIGNRFEQRVQEAQVQRQSRAISQPERLQVSSGKSL